MTLPDLYLIGAPKAGTTSLCSWLSGHPDVYWSVPKEPYFWAADYPAQRAHYGFATRAAYEQLFASPEAAAARVRAEGSTTYLYSQVAVPDILEAVPGARFLVCLRNPVDLVVSYHRTQLVTLNETEPRFAAAWERSMAGGSPGAVPLDTKLVDYAQVGRVGAAVERLLSHTGRERVHFVLLDDLAEDPHAVWEGVAAFCGIDSSVVPEFAVANSSTKTYRSRVLRQLTHRPPAALAPTMTRVRQWSRTSNNSVVRRAKAGMWRPAPRPTVPPEVRQQLTDYFRSDVELLGSLVGRDLVGWTA